MAKLVLIILAVILTVAFAYPASEQETPSSRMAREAKPDPHFGGLGGFGVIGGFKVGGFGGYKHGYGYRPYGYGHHGYGGYGGYPGGYGGYGIPYGSASYASAKAGSIGFGR